MALVPIGLQKSTTLIAWIQDALNTVMDARLIVDGVWGPKTRESIRQFQMTRRLTPDGIVGPQTKDELNRALRGEPSRTLNARTGNAVASGNNEKDEVAMAQAGVADLPWPLIGVVAGVGLLAWLLMGTAATAKG